MVRVTSVLELELAEWIEHNVATLFYWYESSMICFFSEKIIWHEIWQTFHNMINFKINLILFFYTNTHFILDIILKLILPQKSLFSKDVPISKSPASGKENVRFPDSLDFENLTDIRTGRDVR